MIKINTLSIKNFMSIGNVTETINFSKSGLTQIIGENLDSNTNSRNGTGKTTILNALSFVLFGQGISEIKKDNMINNINSKNMVLEINFEIDNVIYKIERGRKPNFLRIFINDEILNIKEDDETSGESKITQQFILKLLKMNHDQFIHMMGLNTYTIPFLQLKTNDQRILMEQFLGIDLLTSKANKLKEQISDLKERLKLEENKRNILEENKRKFYKTIETEIKRKDEWEYNHNKKITEISNEITKLESVDIDKELELHDIIKAISELMNNKNHEEKILKEKNLLIQSLIKRFTSLEKELEALKNHKCISCNQSIAHFDDITLKITNKTNEIEKVQKDVENNVLEKEKLELSIKNYNEDIDALTNFLFEPIYSTKDEAINHKSNLINYYDLLNKKENEINPYVETVESLLRKYETEFSYDNENYDELKKYLNHYEILFKLLTNKESFIRKSIIDQNISYLNHNLSKYLEKLNLPHSVKFLNDLSCEIMLLGKNYDFPQLSRGERTRLQLALSLSFREIWEFNNHSCNLLLIDEVIDFGLDAAGVENSLEILKELNYKKNKNIFLVSHREELSRRVSQILYVKKQNNFTKFYEA